MWITHLTEDIYLCISAIMLGDGERLRSGKVGAVPLPRVVGARAVARLSYPGLLVSR